MLQIRQGSNPQSPDHQFDAHPTEPRRLAFSLKNTKKNHQNVIRYSCELQMERSATTKSLNTTQACNNSTISILMAKLADEKFLNFFLSFLIKT